MDARDLGAVTGADGAHDLTLPGDQYETALGPDVAFVRAERVPPRDSAQYRRAQREAPDLVVDEASLSQHRPEMAAKAQRYLAAGTRLIWVVWPEDRRVDVWRPSASAPVQTLSQDDELDGLDVLPGFSYPLARLFS